MAACKVSWLNSSRGKGTGLGAWSQGITRVEPVKFIGLVQIQIWSYARKRLTEARWCPHIVCTERGLDIALKVAVSFALALKPLTSIFFSMLQCLSSHNPSSRVQGEWLWVNEAVWGPFKYNPGFPATFCHTLLVKISSGFHCKILWGLFFPALET